MKQQLARFARVFGWVAVVLLSVGAWAERAPNIPSGTVVRVRIVDNLSSDIAEIGDTFHGTLDEPLTVNGRDLYPKGADVNGRVVDVHRSGRLSEPGELDLVLTTVSSGRMTSSLAVQPLVIKGESHTKSNATKIGGGAALGAIIGAVAGGGKGAAIGAGVGGAAGTGAAAATGKREAKVESEAVLTFVTTSATVVSSNDAVSPSNPPTLSTRSGASGNAESATASAAPSSSSVTDVNPPQSGAPANSSNGDANTSASTDASPAPSVPAPATDSSDLFTLRDRRVIRSCVPQHASELPSGTVQREDMPTGEERQLVQGGNLSSDVQSKAQALPLACERQLPRLPTNQERVIYKGRILLTDNNGHVLDMFYLDENK